MDIQKTLYKKVLSVAVGLLLITETTNIIM